MNYIKFYFLLFFLFILIGCEYQKNDTSGSFKQNNNIDSVKIYYDMSHDTLKSMSERLSLINRSYELSKQPSPDSVSFISLNYKAHLHHKESELDSAFLFSHEIIRTAKKVKDSGALGKALFKTGYYHTLISKMDSAFIYYDESIKIYKALKDSLKVGSGLSNRAILLCDNGLFNQSDHDALEALGFLKNINDSIIKASTYNCMAINAKNQQDFDEALYWYDLAIKNSNSKRNINTYKSNIAIIKRVRGQYDEAIQIFKQALDTAVMINDKDFSIRNHNEVIRLKDNLYYAQWVKTKDRNLENYFLENLSTKTQNNLLKGLKLSHQHLAEFYEGHDHLKAKFHAQKLLLLAEDANDKNDQLDALRFLVRLSENDPIKYKKYTGRYIQLQDSLAQVLNATEMRIIKIRFDSEANRDENNTLKAQKIQRQLALEKSRAMNTIYLLLGFISLLFFSLIYMFLRSKHKKEKLEEVFKTETRISKKVHDEVANDLYQVMTKLEASEDQQEEIVDDLEKIYEKTRDISRENNDLDLDQDFGTLLKELLLSYHNEEVNVITRGLSHTNWQQLSTQKKIALYRVIQELMTNMKKHSRASVVIMSFSSQGKKINVTYKDDGDGCVIKKNNGLLNVENRINNMDGHINFISEKGKGFMAQLTI